MYTHLDRYIHVVNFVSGYGPRMTNCCLIPYPLASQIHKFEYLAFASPRFWGRFTLCMLIPVGNLSAMSVSLHGTLEGRSWCHAAFNI
jgi:hypothetical protein